MMTLSDRSIISSIYTRLSIDVSAIAMAHVKIDPETGVYQSDMKSGLQNCLTLEANKDQAARQFRQDVAMTLFDKGVAAIVPVDTDTDPGPTAAYDILTLRVGEIVAWFPDKVRILLYNDRNGRKEEITMAKKDVAIVENPLYAVMNEPNGTLQRLLRKLSLLDSLDEQLSSGKLDLIIQLPYVIKSETRRQQANQRRTDIEDQLKGSKYGIAYTDGTEKITQLNRPTENNMVAQVQTLTDMLYAQLGLTKGVFDGTATEKEMTNYFNRTTEPVVTAIVQAMKRSFLSKTARAQGQSVEFYRNPFGNVSLTDLSNVVDVFSRNEIATPNEFRNAMGLKPSKDPAADSLRNKNLPQDQTRPEGDPTVPTDPAALPPVEQPL